MNNFTTIAVLSHCWGAELVDLHLFESEPDPLLTGCGNNEDCDALNPLWPSKGLFSFAIGKSANECRVG